jgi:Icc-related predicted phosphoesterase
MKAKKSAGSAAPGSIRILCVSDYHREKTVADNVERLAAKEKVDVIINAGDFLSQEFAQKVLSATKFRTFVVRGNWDYDVKVRNIRVTFLSNNAAEYKGYYFIGADYRHYSELMKLVKGKDPKKIVLLTHDPPYDILDTSFFGSSAGSVELREFDEKIRPALHVFGHIHESAGIVKYRGTIFVNAALPEFRKAAIVELPSERIRVFDV